ncbi:imidazole glycerol phosphate synthase subunit HisH [Glaesserella parasuis]|nr:imidazole glycerol phosphate synthase subunit HisH [Glaesserella parasuis]MCT8834844.1 imidazole glycerol phosphate synthase subunit HisH [Glaesserella parasuis]
MSNLVIIDTGCANLSSVKFAFDRLGIQAEISRNLAKIKSADKLLLPGVGTAIAAMKNLQDRQLIETIQNATQPMLGICLGMQLMTEFSTEGNVDTLRLMNGKTELIPNTGLPLPHMGLPLPHMGWNRVRYAADHPLFAGIEQDSHFYFVHSYAVLPNENTIATSNYGVDFSAAIASKSFYGVQFHPERSGKNGAQLLKNFVENI